MGVLNKILNEGGDVYCRKFFCRQKLPFRPKPLLLKFRGLQVIADFFGRLLTVKQHDRGTFDAGRGVLQADDFAVGPEDDATIRAMVVFLFDFIEEFRALWDAKRATITQEVDKNLTGLAGKELAEAVARIARPPK